MQVHLYATFRLLAGEKTLDIQLPDGATVEQVVQAVVERCPVLRTHWFDDAGEIYAHVHIFVDGEDVQNLPLGIHTSLAQQAVLDFFPPVAGG